MRPSTTVSVTLSQPPTGSAISRFLWNFTHHPKRELWFAWWVMVVFYNLYGVLFFLVTRVQPPPSPAWDTPMVVQWFDARHYGILAGFGKPVLTWLIIATGVSLGMWTTLMLRRIPPGLELESITQ